MKFLLLLLLFHCMVLAANHNALRTITFSTYSNVRIHNLAYHTNLDISHTRPQTNAPDQRIQTHRLTRMGPYTFTGGQTVSFADLETSQWVARIEVPNDSDQWLFIFVPSSLKPKPTEPDLHYWIYPFNDSTKHLPKNRLRFLNLSGKVLEGFVGTQRVQLPLGESNLFSIQRKLPIHLWTYSDRNRKPVPAHMKDYTFRTNCRYLILFFPPVLSGSADLDVRCLSDNDSTTANRSSLN